MEVEQEFVASVRAAVGDGEQRKKKTILGKGHRAGREHIALQEGTERRR